MTRPIDFSNLSHEDLMYIGQRPWMVGDAERQGHAGVARRVQLALKGITDDGGGGSTAGPKPGIAPDLGATDLLDDEPVEPSDEDEDDDPGYEDWTIPELRQELQEREIELPSGKYGKQELVKLLRDDDAESQG